MMSQNLNKCNWFKCTDKMPDDEYNMYYVYCKCYELEWQMIVHFQDGMFIEPIHNEDGHFVGNKVHNDVVTHWTFLFEPPITE